MKLRREFSIPQEKNLVIAPFLFGSYSALAAYMAAYGMARLSGIEHSHEVGLAVGGVTAVTVANILGVKWYNEVAQVLDRISAPQPEAAAFEEEPGYNQEERVYVEEEDNMTHIYNIPLSKSQLEALHKIIKAGDASLTVDLLVRPPNKFFTQGGLAKFKQDLIDQHIAVKKGTQVVLTERGKRAVEQKWQQAQGLTIRRV